MPNLECMPRWATGRTESRPTFGAQAAKFAAALNTPLMDWQRYVLDVALEYDPNTGQPCYRNIVVTVPRQNGKTTLLLVLFLVRALAHDRQSIVYTAQNRNEAKKKFVNEWIPMLLETNFKNYFETTQANGNEAMKFMNGSLLSLAATTEKSGHGNVIHLGVCDEAFALPDARMEQAFVPAMVTKRDAQFWVVSTAGTYAKSPYLWGKVQNGRQLVEDGARDGTAYFEWSADENADPSSEETWRSCMPALGHTIDMDIIRTIYNSDMDLSEFRRAFLNQWVAAPTEPVISLERWNELVTDDVRTTESWALAFDVAEDRSYSSIAACWKRADGKFQVVLIDTRPGTSWLAPRLADIWHNSRPVGIWLDRSGPAGSVLSDLQNLNVPLVNDVPVSDLAKACGQIYDACIDGTIVHRDDPVLSATLDGAVKRPVSDAWVWSRRTSAIDISPIVAITMAHFGAKAMSRTPQVFSIREIMEEKQRALDAIANQVVVESSDDKDEVPMEFIDVTPADVPPPSAGPVSNVRRIPI